VEVGVGWMEVEVEVEVVEPRGLMLPQTPLSHHNPIYNLTSFPFLILTRVPSHQRSHREDEEFDRMTNMSNLPVILLAL
jgi:hypothetical protein